MKKDYNTEPKLRPFTIRPLYERKRKTFWQRCAMFLVSLNWKGYTLLASLLALVVILPVVFITAALAGDAEPQGGSMETVAESTPAPETQPEPVEPAPEYIFRDGDGTPVDVQAMTDAWAAEYGIEKRYNLTDAERWEVASVVTAEAGGEPFAGKMAVAQCILQSCEDDGIRPCEAVVKYKYAKTRPEPSADALAAVQAVFDFGQVVTTQPIKYFYAPARCTSSFHESQVYVMTINGHRFFAER